MAHAGTLEIRNLSKQYLVKDGPLTVLDDVTLSIRSGEFVSIVGSSGCGKSTLLRLIIGLEADYQGEILLDGKRIVGTSLERGIVFQEHRLFPWLTVEQNVATGVLNAPGSDAAKKKSVLEHIALVGLRGFETAYPHQLSGGMAQRVAIARALVNRPEVLLLDEPATGARAHLARRRHHGHPGHARCRRGGVPGRSRGHHAAASRPHQAHRGCATGALARPQCRGLRNHQG